jgi:hypothetical protein
MNFAGLVDTENVGMLQPGAEPDLSEEPLRSQHRRQVRMQDLERYRAVVPEITGQIDRGHAAAAQLALDDVAIGEGGLQVSVLA